MTRLMVSVAVAAGLFVMAAAATAQARPLKVMALDQCADQYALALAPDAELLLTLRADDPDSWLRADAVGRRKIRPTLEAAVVFRPDVVVSYWGGDARLFSALERQGVRVLTINDARDFDGIERNIVSVSQGLAQPARGQRLVHDMRVKLDRAEAIQSAKHARRAPTNVTYLTASGFTAGAGTLIDAMIQSAGYLNAVRFTGYGPLPVEQIALTPPLSFVLGFFDAVRSDWRGAGRHPVVQKASQGRIAAKLPASALSCPAWFAADAVLSMAEGRS